MTKYDIKEIAATAREALKREFPQCKFAVTIHRYSMGQSMTIALMEGPFVAFASDRDLRGNIRMTDYAQLNHYQLLRHPNGYPDGHDRTCNGTPLTPVAWETMRRATEIGLAEHWDESDIMTDYFHCNFYFHLAIGKWNKPYKVVLPPDQVLETGTVAEFEAAASSGQTISLFGLANALIDDRK